MSEILPYGQDDNFYDGNDFIILCRGAFAYGAQLAIGITSMNEQTVASPPILSDWEANRGNPKGQLVLLLFRLAQHTRALPAPWWMLGLPYLALYRVLVEWILGVELRYKTRVGPRLRLYHGQALVVHEGTVIGADCTLRQSTTIGNKTLADGTPSACPTISDGVDVGANCVVIGPIRIGARAVIGAGSVVVRDVAEGSVIAGNPARPLERRPR